MTSISAASSTTSTYSTYSNLLRLTGLASGIDTDSIVKSLMKAAETKLDTVKQKKQLAEWKQESYQEVTSLLNDFNDKYFDVLSDTYMLSSSTYKTLDTSSSDTSVVTATAGSTATSGTHTIQVQNLATAATMQSASTVAKDINGDSAADFSSAQGKSFVINVDGTKKTITIDEGITSISGLQDAIDKAVGEGKVEVSDTNGDGTGALVISAVEDSGVHSITISDKTTGALSALGFGEDSTLSNRLSTSDTLEEIAAQMNGTLTFDSEDNLNLEINGVSFTISKDTKLSEMMEQINESDAGVTMEYDKVNNKFVFTAAETGAGNTIEVSESGSNFLTAAGITDYTEGEDAVVLIDGEKYTRSSNTVEADGVTYALVSESDEVQTVSVTKDTDAVYDLITGFVEDYNTLIETINDKLSEEYDYDYQPLTDDQKEEMTDEQIEDWEAQAKTGLLANDLTLNSMLTKIRTALYTSVEGVTGPLSSIGISTEDYEDNGKLVIDETTLKQAIEEDPESVISLFCQGSETYSGKNTNRDLSSYERSVRSEEEGIAYRVYDILQDYISTTRDGSGNKGILIEKAGVDDDSSETDNYFYNLISDYDEKIDYLTNKLEEKEDYYYSKFTAMETALSNLNSQANLIANFSSSGS